MRCYFNLSNGESYFTDLDGVEVASLDQAHGEAVNAIRETFLDRNAADFDLEGWALDVVDPAGRVLLSMSLEDVMEAPRIDGLDNPFDLLQ
ncbi:DUF6894 family protein [Microvirga thermotolerans]|uniref:DUF6894 domain-containing protein n=1 Tax=Microvirga thermotolerans TaxID=2651334 RepID=A0A5P9JYT4_9HYPH|nr:hypothetical protein [Microvirga thermotolerans]QFU17593.1 hypothetical protein GDR74_16000 [Microvirga thermotolerans]